MRYFDYLLSAENWGGTSGIGALLLQHVEFTVISVLVAAAISIPLGLLIGHTGRGNGFVVGLSNSARAIPTLGLIVLIVLIFGTRPVLIVVVLVILAIPPILTATAAGISGADREAVLAARGLGMTGGQVVAKVEWPLALPLVISGLRSASLQVVATATVAAYVSFGGLGRLIIDGVRLQDYSRTVTGAVLVGLLALALDVILGVVGRIAGRRSRPRSHRSTKRRALAEAT